MVKYIIVKYRKFQTVHESTSLKKSKPLGKFYKIFLFHFAVEISLQVKENLK